MDTLPINTKFINAQNLALATAGQETFDKTQWALTAKPTDKAMIAEAQTLLDGGKYTDEEYEKAAYTLSRDSIIKDTKQSYYTENIRNAYEAKDEALEFESWINLLGYGKENSSHDKIAKKHFDGRDSKQALEYIRTAFSENIIKGKDQELEDFNALDDKGKREFIQGKYGERLETKQTISNNEYGLVPGAMPTREVSTFKDMTDEEYEQWSEEYKANTRYNQLNTILGNLPSEHTRLALAISSIKDSDSLMQFVPELYNLSDSELSDIYWASYTLNPETRNAWLKIFGDIGSRFSDVPKFFSMIYEHGQKIPLNVAQWVDKQGGLDEVLQDEAKLNKVKDKYFTHEFSVMGTGFVYNNNYTMDKALKNIYDEGKKDLRIRDIVNNLELATATKYSEVGKIQEGIISGVTMGVEFLGFALLSAVSGGAGTVVGAAARGTSLASRAASVAAFGLNNTTKAASALYWGAAMSMDAQRAMQGRGFTDEEAFVPSLMIGAFGMYLERLQFGISTKNPFLAVKVADFLAKNNKKELIKAITNESILNTAQKYGKLFGKEYVIEVGQEFGHTLGIELAAGLTGNERKEFDEITSELTQSMIDLIIPMLTVSVMGAGTKGSADVLRDFSRAEKLGSDNSALLNLVASAQRDELAIKAYESNLGINLRDIVEYANADEKGKAKIIQSLDLSRKDQARAKQFFENTAEDYLGVVENFSKSIQEKLKTSDSKLDVAKAKNNPTEEASEENVMGAIQPFVKAYGLNVDGFEYIANLENASQEIKDLLIRQMQKEGKSQEEIERILQKNSIEGFYHNGKIYIVGSKKLSPERAKQVLKHEYTHKQSSPVRIGEDFRKFVDEVLNANGGEAFVRAAIRAVKGNVYDNLDRYALGEDFIAMLSEKVLGEHEMSEKELSVWQRIKDFAIDKLARLPKDREQQEKAIANLIRKLWAGELDGEFFADTFKEFSKGNKTDTRFSFADEDPDRELDEVRAKYANTDTYMKAPNGADTKLTEQQWLQVRTSSFKKWFGDWESDPESSSKVIDENGEPLVVYHGTNSTNEDYSKFTVFKGDMYFFSNNTDIAGSMGSTKYSIFLNIKNPLIINADGDVWGAVQDHTNTKKLFDDLTAKEKSKVSKRLQLNNKELENWFKGQVVDLARMGAIDSSERTTNEWGYYSKSKGYDGTIIVDIRDGAGISEMDTLSNNYIAFNPNQIKSATDNTGAFDGNNNDIRFSFADDSKNLVVLHNLTEGKLQNANSLGGFAMPSLGVRKFGVGVSGYGEISLIAPNTILNSRGVSTYSSDIYSPRYPRVELSWDGKALNDEIDKLVERFKSTGEKISDWQIENWVDNITNISDLYTRWELAQLYSNETGIDVRGEDWEHDPKYLAWVGEVLSGFENIYTKRIFTGFTPSGTRKYIPETLANVVKIMKKEALRGGEGGSFYVFGQIKAMLSKKFKNIKEIQKNRDDISNTGDSAAAFEKAQTDLNELTAKLQESYPIGGNHFMALDAHAERIKEAVEKSIDYMNNEYYDGKLNQETISKINKLFSDIRKLPSNYFEAKAQRAVSLNEFVGAIIPENANSRTRQILDSNNIPYKEYTSEQDRQSVLDGFTKELDNNSEKIRFSFADEALDTQHKELYERYKQGDETALAEAQSLVDNVAEARGYNNNEDWKLRHTAPRARIYSSMEEFENDAESVSIVNLAEGYDIVPSDMWDNPTWFGGDERSVESAIAIKKAMDKAKIWIKKGKKGKVPTIKIYRSVPASVKEEAFRNGDWVSPSKDYVESHGESVIEGDFKQDAYRVISKTVPITDVWWDGNAPEELGYDDGSNYVYSNTKNNRKLQAPFTLDDSGELVPISERFNSDNEDMRFSFADEVEGTDKQLRARGKAIIQERRKLIEKNKKLDETQKGIELERLDLQAEFYTLKDDKKLGLLEVQAKKNPDIVSNSMLQYAIDRGEAWAEELFEKRMQDIEKQSILKETETVADFIANDGYKLPTPKAMRDYDKNNNITVGGTLIGEIELLYNQLNFAEKQKYFTKDFTSLDDLALRINGEMGTNYEGSADFLEDATAQILDKKYKEEETKLYSELADNSRFEQGLEDRDILYTDDSNYEYARLKAIELSKAMYARLSDENIQDKNFAFEPTQEELEAIELEASDMLPEEVDFIINRARSISMNMLNKKAEAYDDYESMIEQEEKTLEYSKVIDESIREYENQVKQLSRKEAMAKKLEEIKERAKLRNVKGFTAQELETAYGIDLTDSIIAMDEEGNIIDPTGAITQTIEDVFAECDAWRKETGAEYDEYLEKARLSLGNMFNNAIGEFGFANHARSAQKALDTLLQSQTEKELKDKALKLAKKMSKFVEKESAFFEAKAEKKAKRKEEREVKRKVKADINRAEKKAKAEKKKLKALHKKLVEQFLRWAKRQKSPKSHIVDIKRKLPAKTEEYLSIVKKVMLLSDSEVEKRFEELNTAKAKATSEDDLSLNDGLTLKEIYEMGALVMFGNIQDKTIAQLLTMREEINKLVKGQREAQLNKRESLKAKVQATAAPLIESLETRKYSETTKGNEIAGGLKGASTFKHLLNGIFLRGGLPNSTLTSIKKWINDLSKRVSDASLEERNFITSEGEWLDTQLSTVYAKMFVGGKLNSVAKQALERLAKIDPALAKFSSVKGRDMSLGQILNILAMLEQRQVYSAYRNLKASVEAKINKGEEISESQQEAYDYWEGLYSKQEAMQKLLSEEDFALVRALKERYAKRADLINSVFEPLNGLPLAVNGGDYMPISRKGDNNLDGAKGARVIELFPGHYKPRSINLRELDENASIIQVFNQRAVEDAHFINFAGLIFENKELFRNKEFSKLLKENLNQKDYKQLMDFMLDILSGKLKPDTSDTSVISNLIARATSVIGLAWNLPSAFKQLASTPAFMLEVATSEFFGGYKDLMASGEFFAIMKEYWNSPFLKDRRNGNYITQVLADIEREKLRSPVSSSVFDNAISRVFRKGMFKPLQYMDSAANLLGGAGIYYHLKKKYSEFMDEKEASRLAMLDVAEIGERTQQSSLTMNMGTSQRENSGWAKLFNSFRSTNQLYLSYEVDAFRKWKANRTKENSINLAKTLVLNHFVLPLLFNTGGLLANMFLGDDIDDEDMEYFLKNTGVSMAFGVFQGWWLSAIVPAIAQNMVLGKNYDISSSMLPASGLSRVVSLLSRFITADFVDDSVASHLDKTLSALMPSYRIASKATKNYLD